MLHFQLLFLRKGGFFFLLRSIVIVQDAITLMAFCILFASSGSPSPTPILFFQVVALKCNSVGAFCFSCPPHPLRLSFAMSHRRMCKCQPKEKMGWNRAESCLDQTFFMLSCLCPGSHPPPCRCGFFFLYVFRAPGNFISEAFFWISQIIVAVQI